MNLTKLKELGLTDGEAKVYTALLNLGQSTKGPIASKANVSESKVYEILDRLKDKGLVSQVQKQRGSKRVTHYKAADPSLLKEFLNKKRKAIDKEEKLLKDILPSLHAMQTAKEKEYSATVYEGFKGIQANNKELLNQMTKKDDWIAMGVRSSKAKKFNIFWINYLKQRAKKGGKARILFVDKGTEYYKKLKKIPNTKVGHLQSISPAAVIVTMNKTMIYNYGESPTCLTITNQEVADSFRGFFESLWSQAKF